MLLVVALFEFLLVAACGTRVFLIITPLPLINVIAGATVSTVTARPNMAIGEPYR